MHDSRVLSVAIAFVAMLLGFSHAEAREPSRVMRIRIPAFVEGRYDVEIVLHHQTGRFHHGYALVPARDNILHRIEVVPAKPIAWRDRDGADMTNLHDARLVWVAEDLLPGGTGMTRGGFALRPFPWTGFAAADAFGSPAVADNRVFLYTSQPDVEHLAHHPPPEGDNAFYRLGIKAAVFGRRVDVVSAYDARTGRRLWRHVGGAGAAGNRGKGKSTNGVTPLVVGERVLVRGAACGRGRRGAHHPRARPPGGGAQAGCGGGSEPAVCRPCRRGQPLCPCVGIGGAVERKQP